MKFLLATILSLAASIANATTTYTYGSGEDPSLYSGSFSVPSPLKAGTFNLTNDGTFFKSNSFEINDINVKVDLTLSAFNVTVNRAGKITAWDLVATSPLTWTQGKNTYRGELIVTDSNTGDYTQGFYAVGKKEYLISDSSSAEKWSIKTITTPVPEPTEGMLMLSGMGLLGFIASRKNQ